MMMMMMTMMMMMIMIMVIDFFMSRPGRGAAKVRTIILQ